MAAKFNYQATADTALRLIERFGQPIEISTESGGSFDLILSIQTPPTITIEKCNGTVKDFGIKDIDGTLVFAGDKLLTIPANGISKPAITNKVSFGGSDYSIIPPVIEVSPAGLPITYKLHIRG